MNGSSSSADAVASATASATSGGWLRGLGWALLAVVLFAHCWALYAPGSPGPPEFAIPGLDKAVHVGLFAVPALLIGRLSRASWPGWVLVVHAPISELGQHCFIPFRSGDPFDLVADFAGVAIGWWAAGRFRRS